MLVRRLRPAARNRLPMTFVPFALCIAAVLSAGCAISRSGAGEESAISFEYVGQTAVPAPIEWIEASDGTELALRRYVPEAPEATIILFHGGGAHSGAGYQRTARRLAEVFGYVLVTPDLRGHGRSGGARGDAPSTERIFKDINEILAHVDATLPELPLVLAGHSSGAGLLLNYAEYRRGTEAHGGAAVLNRPGARGANAVAAYAFLAPFFGFRSDTGRKGGRFSEAKTWPFALNAMSFGLFFGHYHAVEVAYPQSVLDGDPLLLRSISVNTANAVTPTAPAEQLASLEAPTAIWIGSEDRVVDPTKLAGFIASNAPGVEVTALSGVEHLEILTAGAAPLGVWIRRVATR